MATLLFEIGCEELPAAACREAERQLPELSLRHLAVRPAALYVGPRRLAIRVDELPERAPGEERRGPAERIAFDEAGNPTAAAEGFARAAGVAVDELERRDGHVWARAPGEPLAESLSARLAAIVRELAFGKSMRWTVHGLRFARPVRWTCATLDAETVAVELDGIPSEGRTFGRRFGGGSLDVSDAASYAELLRAAGVEPDAEERRRAIVSGLDELGQWGDPAGVLEEVVYLVERPLVLAGRFDERFLTLPERVVTTAMQSHQRYFPLGENRFAFVANGGDPDVVVRGNERVLEGRLDDAAFTFERDVAKGIDALAGELGSITFFAGAGTFTDKAERLRRLVEHLGGGEASREAARLAKADQASELVREFPELEGYIGAEYARLAGYPEAVCSAIEEHYLPDTAGGPLPETEAGRVLAAADKIDNLTVAFSLGHKPTGSRDPYGLRRDAIGLCRLAIEGGLTVPLQPLAPDVRDFVEERLEGLLDVPVEFVRAARRSSVGELGALAHLAEALARAGDGVIDAVHRAYTRADRLAGRSRDEVRATLDPDVLVEEAEIELARALQEIEPELQAAVEAADFETALATAGRLAPPVDRFFDDVLVMADDRALRENRLRLLLEVRDTLAQLGDFSQIPR